MKIWHSEQACLVAGKWKITNNTYELNSPYNKQSITKIHMAGEKEVEASIAESVSAFEDTKRLPAYVKAEICMSIHDQLVERKEEVAQVLSAEAGKPIKDALGETERAINTFRIASEEARRLEGEFVPLDSMKAGENQVSIIKRYPIGPIAAISPFNFPLNLVAHKLAPAIAAGCPIVLKPATKTPLSALIMGEMILKTKWPRNAISIIPCNRKVGNQLVTDKRFKMLTFTGSPSVGWPMKVNAGPKKKVVLELGGNAGVIIDKDADLDFAAERVKAGGFGFAGQSCISVQRVYVHKEVESEFTKLLLEKIKTIKMGDPSKEETNLGPMIDANSAMRTQEWVKEAVSKGANLLIGGKADGNFFPATVLSNVKREAKICSEEAFAPVLIIESFANMKEAFDKLNDSVYGLQAGVFTDSNKFTWDAFDELDVGGVIINDVPTFRVDQMPYGGIKESGIGREGPKYAIEDMTEMKILVINRGSK